MKIRCRSCEKLVENSEEWGSGPFICPQCRGSQVAGSTPGQDSAKQPSGPVLTGDQQKLLAKYQRASTAVGVLMLIMGGGFVIAMPIALRSTIATETWGVAATHITIFAGLCFGFLTLGVLSVQRNPRAHFASGPLGIALTLGYFLQAATLFDGNIPHVVGKFAGLAAVLAIGIGGVYCLVQARRLKAAGIDPRMKRS